MASTSSCVSFPSSRNALAKSVTTLETASAPAITAEFSGSTPIKDPAPIAGSAVTRNNAKLLNVISFYSIPGVCIAFMTCFATGDASSA